MVKEMLRFGKGGRAVELVEHQVDIDSIPQDVLISLVNESLRRHYSTKWRQGYVDIVDVGTLLSHVVSKEDRALAFTVQLTEDDYLYLASCKDAKERSAYLRASKDERALLRKDPTE